MRTTTTLHHLDIAIGARIRARRKFLGLSQDALARGVGVTFQQVQKYERGVNRVSGSKLIAIAETLQTTVAALTGENEETAVPDAAYKAFTISGAPELLRAYGAIPSANTRAAVLMLVRSLAGDAVGTEAAAEAEPVAERA